MQCNPLLVPHNQQHTFPKGVSTSFSSLSFRMSGAPSPEPPIIPICSHIQANSSLRRVKFKQT